MTAKTATKKLKITQPRTKTKKPNAAAQPPEAASPAAKVTGRARTAADLRSPPVGTTLTKTDRTGKVRCACTVEKDGVRYGDKLYATLSGAAVAAAKDLGLSGNTFNGFVFWQVVKPLRAAQNPAERLELLWKRYAEVLGKAVDGEHKAVVTKVAKTHGAALAELIA